MCDLFSIVLNGENGLRIHLMAILLSTSGDTIRGKEKIEGEGELLQR